MTATCALTLPRRPQSVPGMRLLPVTPNEPPYDDEIEPAPVSTTGRPSHTRIRPARRAGGAADRTARPAADPGGGGHRRGSTGSRGGGRPATPPGGRTTERPESSHADTDRTGTGCPDTAADHPSGPRSGEQRAGGGTVTVDRSPRQLAVPEQVFTEAGPLRPASGDLPATGRRPARAPATGRPVAPAREAAVIVVRAIVEALGGVRPVSHLAGWTTPRLQSDLERIAAQLSDRRRGQVRSVRVSEPRPGVAEVSAVISRGARAAALALRMEAAGGRWRVTTLQVG
ncbi:Rv3235 family protein [Frankia sp. QA3]|uniref:Rv3235 family protein n=1 Tax=Frankia sp. QA3 TaxID=710111 RepID=UPI000269C500|nr:Rv3235 family protein [Frankia sp. QA3]EIV93928.1 hypothetical protein FraQA3DRAFT_3652 [Frankia sp. QA3]